MRRRLTILAKAGVITLIVALLAACGEESGDRYAKVPEGKIAPASAVLVKAWAQKENFDPAAYKREFRSSLTQQKVSEFYDVTLTNDGWTLTTGHLMADILQWEKDNISLTVAHDMKKSDASHWVVAVRPTK